MLSLLAGAVLYVQQPQPFLEANLPHYTDELVAQNPYPYPHLATSTEDRIRAVFKEEGERAIKIAKCESNLVPTSTNISAVEISYGLFQINTKAHKDADPQKLFEIGYNIEYAKALFDKEGWRPWVCNKLI